MVYYRSDFADDNFSQRHPAINSLIWFAVCTAIVCTLAYFGGIQYVIADLLK
jgi:hypothetical protein